MALLIIAIAFTAVSQLYYRLLLASNTPVIRMQANSIAHAYLEEIMHLPLTHLPAVVPPCSGSITHRSQIIHLYQYLCISPQISDLAGNIIPEYNAFSIKVTLQSSQFMHIPSQLVTVSVLHTTLKTQLHAHYLTP